MYKIASLFSGCGGLDLGFTGGFDFFDKHFDKLPTEIVFANDFDKDASTCYNSNDLLIHDGAMCTLADIRSVDANDILDFDIQLLCQDVLRYLVVSISRRSSTSLL